MELRHGVNPRQPPASAVPTGPGPGPLRVVNGTPSYVNLLDGLVGWQLVREAAGALGQPVAASFKHASPAGAALAGPIDAETAERHGLGAAPGALASAYVRARDADPRASYGDLAAFSAPVDEEIAHLLGGLVCDGIVAPGYSPGAVAALSRKRRGNFLVLEADPGYTPPPADSREEFGLRLTQGRDDVPITPDLLADVACGHLSPSAADDLLLGLTVVRYTRSHSVCYVKDGVTVGIGAGQQSRVDCTRLAGRKADTWWMRQHPAVRGLEFDPAVRRQDRVNWQLRCAEGDVTPYEVEALSAVLAGPVPAAVLWPHNGERRAWLGALSGLAFTSDGALASADNVEQAAAHGVRWIAEPGGSIRSGSVVEACGRHGITLVHTGLRLFRH